MMATSAMLSMLLVGKRTNTRIMGNAMLSHQLCPKVLQSGAVLAPTDPTLFGAGNNNTKQT
ncbi:unnamed protein product [Timema podura]|uniref:NADH dehydrogenase subunit 4L n=1 Tax=Timema podura TaxID=61482 RepID=A0ABN7P7N8_TIMPD|nr:unnamed protein product [Timema podura]